MSKEKVTTRELRELTLEYGPLEAQAISQLGLYDYVEVLTGIDRPYLDWMSSKISENIKSAQKRIEKETIGAEGWYRKSGLTIKPFPTLLDSYIKKSSPEDVYLKFGPLNYTRIFYPKMLLGQFHENQLMNEERVIVKSLFSEGFSEREILSTCEEPVLRLDLERVRQYIRIFGSENRKSKLSSKNRHPPSKDEGFFHSKNLLEGFEEEVCVGEVYASGGYGLGSKEYSPAQYYIYSFDKEGNLLRIGVLPFEFDGFTGLAFSFLNLFTLSLSNCLLDLTSMPFKSKLEKRVLSSAQCQWEKIC